LNGDDDAAFEDEGDAVADNIHADVIFKGSAAAVINHRLVFDVNRFYPPLVTFVKGGTLFLSELTDTLRFQEDLPNGPHEPPPM
jgi:hypothetical protein